MARKKKFNVGDMVRYYDPVANRGDFPNGTIGVIIEVNNDKDKEHLAVRVYFQNPSRYNHYQTLVRRDNIIPEKDWDKYWPTELASQLDISGSIQTEMR